jgi:signal transduction histidine kinase/ligand-binding sensor domain-containing protein
MKQKQHSLNKIDLGVWRFLFLVSGIYPWFIRCGIFLLGIMFIPGVTCSQNSITVTPVSLPQPFDHSEIKHMMLDNEGFLWFVTNQGIWRFDGTDVQPVDIHNPVLPQNAVPEDIYRYDNFLFFSLIDIPTNTYSVLYYNIGDKSSKQFKMSGKPLNFMVDNAGDLSFITTDGSKWVFAKNSGLRQTDKYFTRRGWVKGGSMDYYVCDKDGTTYILSHKQVGLIKKDSIVWGKVKVTVTDQRPTFARRGYCNSRYIFVDYAGGLVVYDKTNLQKVFENHDANYTLSLPTTNSLLPVLKVIKDLRVQCMYPEPGTGKTLVGTDKGLLEISPSFEKPDETDQRQLIVDFFKNKSVRSIYRAPNGKLYVGTYQGFFVFDGHAFKQVCPLIGYTIEPVSLNTLLVGMEGGNGFFLVDTRTDKAHLNPNRHQNLGTTKIIKYGNGYLTGAYGYIYYLTALPDGNYKVKPWLKDADFGIVKDLKLIDGRLWVASVGGVYKVTKNGQTRKVYPAGRNQACYSMLEDNGGIWIGTNGEGLVKIDTGGKLLKAIHFNDGLAGEYVYSLFKLNNLVVAGTSGGASIFDQSSGMQPLTISDLPPADGNLYQEFNHSALLDDRAGHKLILGGTQGLTFIDKDYLASVAGKADDRVRLSYIKTGYSTSRPTASDIFVSKNDTIQILPDNTFTGIKFSGPFNQKYILFRIRELDMKWHQGKLSDEVSLFAIRPGKYTLEARFPSVTDPRYWLSKTIIVIPHFYQTLFFKFIIALVIALAIYMAWLARVRKIKAEHLLRTTIASDLHDEIGSTLTRISINTELLAMSKQINGEDLEVISNDSKKAISSISDIIWSVDARNDNKEDLVLRMKDHAHKMLEDIAAVHYMVNGLSSGTNIPQSLRQNIYLIFKEAINNIVRHNVSPEVWINMENGPNGFAMEIKNTIQRKKGTGYHGQGLRNMEMRARRINATLKVAETDGIFAITLKMKELK